MSIAEFSKHFSSSGGVSPCVLCNVLRIERERERKKGEYNKKKKKGGQGPFFVLPFINKERERRGRKFHRRQTYERNGIIVGIHNLSCRKENSCGGPLDSLTGIHEPSLTISQSEKKREFKYNTHTQEKKVKKYLLHRHAAPLFSLLLYLDLLRRCGASACY